MTELTIYSTEEDCTQWQSQGTVIEPTDTDAIYALCRAASIRTIGVGAPYQSAGIYGLPIGSVTYRIYYPSIPYYYYTGAVLQAGLVFATGSIPDGSEINSVILELYGEAYATYPVPTDREFTVECRKIDDGFTPEPSWWGNSLANVVPIAEYWLPGDELASNTLLATFDTTGYVTSGYNTFTSENSFKDLLEDGDTTLLLCSKDATDNTNPHPATLPNVGEDDQIIIDYSTVNFTARYTADGNTTDPKLVIQYSGAVANQQELCAHF